MSFSRNKYDQFQYDKYLKSVASVEDYTLNAPPNNCNECFQTNPSVIHGQFKNNSQLRNTNVESELTGLNYKLGNQKFIPDCNVDGNQCKTQAFKGGADNNNKCNIITDDTRLSNPASNLRGTGWNRFEWPLVKMPLYPRDQVPSRTTVRDNYLAPDVNPIDQSPALPKGGPLGCDKTTSVCAPYLT